MDTKTYRWHKNYGYKYRHRGDIDKHRDKGKQTDKLMSQK